MRAALLVVIAVSLAPGCQLLGESYFVRHWRTADAPAADESGESSTEPDLTLGMTRTEVFERLRGTSHHAHSDGSIVVRQPCNDFRPDLYPLVDFSRAQLYFDRSNALDAIVVRGYYFRWW